MALTRILPVIIFATGLLVPDLPQAGTNLAIPKPTDMLLPPRLATEIVGEEIISPGGSTIQITGVHTYGSGDNLISEVTVTGGMNGKLYLQGKPALSPDGQTPEFHDFTFTMETSNVLMRFANRMMYDTIRDKLLPYMKIDLANRVELLHRRVQRQMNRELAEGIWIEGAITTVAPRTIYPVKGGIEMLLVIDGTLSLIIQ